MQLPPLPTDNLYKFMALGGVTLLIASVYMYWIFARKLWDRIDELRIDLAVLEVDLSHMERRVEDARKAGALPAGDKAALADMIQDIARRHSTQKVKDHIIKRLLIELVFVTVVAIAGVSFGVSLSTRGFTLWYERLQVFQDRAVQALPK